MQFVKNGPDIPEKLLQAHEDGNVVFFCGAGISYPAGLPGFQGLTKNIYADLGVTPNPIQQAALKKWQFDMAIDLLERDYPGRRKDVRNALANNLIPDLAKPSATATHRALLTLAKNRKGKTRLVTTNFDRLFEEVIGTKSISLERFQAPLIPVPKQRWDSLIYLHGLLPSGTATENELDRLVVSSGDFGLAYLTERWAARFVSELFRNFIVCFVGYSLNDPVLRYMTDALAADQMMGESSPEMFSFDVYSRGKQGQRANEWHAKNVTPILYKAFKHHYYLHKTLHTWSEIYRDGAQGKESIVVQHAMARPQGSTKQDDFVGRMVWALSDPSGLPAKRFAEINPAPPLDWLAPLIEQHFAHDDLVRFGIQPQPQKDNKLKFSMMARPALYTHAQWMSLVYGQVSQTRLDDVMAQLAHWLLRHLNNP
ncbi:MAG: SIR2 family protein, partial [Magnetococcales bacterium]|nr:SIR2 family protein [Magnetococcales bacterium]